MIDRPLFYDQDGNGISRERWAELFEDTPGRIVQQTMTGDVWVSTVWMGIDFNFWPEGKPLIYETMVFDRAHDILDQQRYSTQDQARTGHWQLVAKYGTGVPDSDLRKAWKGKPGFGGTAPPVQ